MALEKKSGGARRLVEGKMNENKVKKISKRIKPEFLSRSSHVSRIPLPLVASGYHWTVQLEPYHCRIYLLDNASLERNRGVWVGIPPWIHGLLPVGRDGCGGGRTRVEPSSRISSTQSRSSAQRPLMCQNHGSVRRRPSQRLEERWCQLSPRSQERSFNKWKPLVS